MKSKTVILQASLVLMASVSTGTAGELITSIEFNPSIEPAPQTKGKVTALDSTSIRTDEAGVWTYEFSESSQLFGTIELDLDGLPSGYKFYSLQMQIPFYVDANLKVNLLATNVTTDRKAVQALRSSAANLGELSMDALLRVYQTARAISDKRLKELEAGTRQVHANDLEAVFIALQTAREVSFRRYILPDALVTRMKDWLATQLVDRQLLVKSTLGADPGTGRDNAAIVLADINHLEAAYLQGLYDRVRDLPSAESKRQCGLFKELEAYLNEMDPDRITPIKKDIERIKTNTSAAVAMCLNRQLAAAIEAYKTLDQGNLETVQKALEQASQQVQVLHGLADAQQGNAAKEATLRARELNALVKSTSNLF